MYNTLLIKVVNVEVGEFELSLGCSNVELNIAPPRRVSPGLRDRRLLLRDLRLVPCGERREALQQDPRPEGHGEVHCLHQELGRLPLLWKRLQEK